MQKKALITGITGFVGSHLVDYLLTKDVDVHGLLRWRSSIENISHCMDQVNLHHGDLTDLPSLIGVLEASSPDYIFHLAAQSYVPYSFNSPISTLNVNCQGTCNLLEAVKMIFGKARSPRIHVCSSSEVYGQVKQEELPINENCPLRPASPYAVSKVAEDMLAFQYWLSWGLDIVRTRLFTHTGARRGEVFATSNFAKQIVEIEKGKKSPVIDVGNLDSVRTFMDVQDAVRAYWLLVNKCSAGEVYNIGGESTMTVGDMLNHLLKHSTVDNIDIKIDPSRLRPSDVTLQIPDTSKFRAITGWKPEIPFEHTMLDLLNYWRCKLSA